MNTNKLIVQKSIKINTSKKIMQVILDGSNILYKNDYLDIISKEFDFPTDCEGLVDRYLDWMRDLSWLNYDKIEIIIYHQQDFIKNESKWRNIILEGFSDYILPYWEHDVLFQCVEGKCKEFNVYLVDYIEK